LVISLLLHCDLWSKEHVRWKEELRRDVVYNSQTNIIFFIAIWWICSIRKINQKFIWNGFMNQKITYTVVSLLREVCRLTIYTNKWTSPNIFGFCGLYVRKVLPISFQRHKEILLPYKYCISKAHSKLRKFCRTKDASRNLKLLWKYSNILTINKRCNFLPINTLFNHSQAPINKLA
jgi:hypothetical protein